MTTKRKILSQPVFIPMIAGALFADEQGEISGGTFVTAFRQRDLLILRQVEGDKKVTIDFSAEHAYVDRGDSAVETFSDIELISTDMPFGRARG